MKIVKIDTDRAALSDVCRAIRALHWKGVLFYRGKSGQHLVFRDAKSDSFFGISATFKQVGDCEFIYEVPALLPIKDFFKYFWSPIQGLKTKKVRIVFNPDQAIVIRSVLETTTNEVVK
jgi:hypothetical protein